MDPVTRRELFGLGLKGALGLSAAARPSLDEVGALEAMEEHLRTTKFYKALQGRLVKADEEQYARELDAARRASETDDECDSDFAHPFYDSWKDCLESTNFRLWPTMCWITLRDSKMPR